MNSDNWGFQNNDLNIVDDILTKAKTIKAKQIIDDETNFYKYILENNINFPIPIIFAMPPGGLLCNI